jgi:hypothetical protein
MYAKGTGRPLVFPPRISNATAIRSRPSGATTTPTLLSMSASVTGTDPARREPASAPLATASAPRSSRGAPGGTAAASARRTTLSMSFRALAAFMLDAVEQHAHVHQIVGLAA